jgi:hypothetical protein
MRNDVFVLFGKDTLEMIGVSHGGAHRAKWSLQQHPGPYVSTYCLLGRDGGSPVRYLYPQHLELLYERFGQANPSGVELDDQDEIDNGLNRTLGRQVVDRMMEERGAFLMIEHFEEQLRYPKLRPYLPEIFEPEMVQRMEADPWLDVALLDEALRQGHVPHRRDYDPRWSPEWRAYCDRAAARR